MVSASPAWGVPWGRERGQQSQARKTRLCVCMPGPRPKHGSSAPRYGVSGQVLRGKTHEPGLCSLRYPTQGFTALGCLACVENTGCYSPAGLQGSI